MSQGPPPLPYPNLKTGSAGKLRRAVRVAQVDGWSVGVFGGMSILFGLTSVWGWIVGIGLVIIAYVELNQAGALRRLDGRALQTLGRNQLFLAGLIVVYAVWNIVTELTGHWAEAEVRMADPEIAQMLKGIEPLVEQLTLAVYGCLIAVAIFAQGGLALYYFSRQKHFDQYLHETPESVQNVLREGRVF